MKKKLRRPRGASRKHVIFVVKYPKMLQNVPKLHFLNKQLRFFYFLNKKSKTSEKTLRRPRGANRKYVIFLIFHELIDFLELFFINLSMFWNSPVKNKVAIFHKVVDFLELSGKKKSCYVFAFWVDFWKNYFLTVPPK